MTREGRTGCSHPDTGFALFLVGIGRIQGARKPAHVTRSSVTVGMSGAMPDTHRNISIRTGTRRDHCSPGRGRSSEGPPTRKNGADSKYASGEWSGLGATTTRTTMDTTDL